MRLKITITCTREFAVNPDSYRPGMSEEEIILCEREGAEEDPYLFLDSPNATIDVKVEKVDE